MNINKTFPFIDIKVILSSDKRVGEGFRKGKCNH